MPSNIVGATRQAASPILEKATVDAVRAEMRRIEAAHAWRALVAECAARGQP